MKSDTLQQLAEFRRRKQSERAACGDELPTKKPNSTLSADFEGSDRTSVPPSRPCTIKPTESGSRNTQIPFVNNVKDVSPLVDSSAESTPSSSAVHKFFNWLYVLVMPEQRPTETDGPPGDSATVDDIDDMDLDIDSATAMDLLPPPPMVTGLFSKLPPWMRYQHLWGLLAWCCGFALAVRFGWGAVYFVISVLLFIWKSLNDSRRRKPGALSAYSVFNPNCERIEGTLDAEQLQRQMFLRF